MKVIYFTYNVTFLYCGKAAFNLADQSTSSTICLMFVYICVFFFLRCQTGLVNTSRDISRVDTWYVPVPRADEVYL